MRIWEQPWGYREGFIVAVGILFSGLLLQFSVGNIQPTLFAYPVNGIIGILFVIGLLAVHFLFPRNRTVRWFGGVYAAVPAITIFLLLCVILGLIPQHSHSNNNSQLPSTLLATLGWNRMTTSWPFVLLCMYLVFILGLTTLRRTRQKQSWRDIGFYINHVGLFLALFGGLLGSADMERLTMSVSEGEVEWRAINQLGEIKELPLAIQLDSFLIEEYLPKLVLIENETGSILPAEKPENYQFEDTGKTVRLAGYTLEILEYLPHAAILRGDSNLYAVPILMEGAASAIKVKATPPGRKESVTGWVSNGSYLFPHSILPVSENTSIAMPQQEIKRYRSYVTFYTENGGPQQAIIEVNKPLSIGNWMIYQYSYDVAKGKYSDRSIYELVRDPWLKVVYAGIFMLLAGAMFLFIAGPKKVESEESNTQSAKTKNV